MLSVPAMRKTLKLHQEHGPKPFLFCGPEAGNDLAQCLRVILW